MTYTEKELDQFLHGISLSLLSKKSAQHWRYDEETAREIEWLEALERKVRADMADRKTEPQTEAVMPKKCKGCDSASKIIEAYSRGFMDGADAVKDMTQTFTADGIVFAKMDEPQTERSE